MLAQTKLILVDGKPAVTLDTPTLKGTFMLPGCAWPEGALVQISVAKLVTERTQATPATVAASAPAAAVPAVTAAATTAPAPEAAPAAAPETAQPAETHAQG